MRAGTDAQDVRAALVLAHDPVTRRLLAIPCGVGDGRYDDDVRSQVGPVVDLRERVVGEDRGRTLHGSGPVLLRDRVDGKAGRSSEHLERTHGVRGDGARGPQDDRDDEFRRLAVLPYEVRPARRRWRSTAARSGTRWSGPRRGRAHPGSRRPVRRTLSAEGLRGPRREASASTDVVARRRSSLAPAVCPWCGSCACRRSSGVGRDQVWPQVRSVQVHVGGVGLAGGHPDDGQGREGQGDHGDGQRAARVGIDDS